MKKIVIITFVMLFSMASWGQIAAWDFYGESNQATSTADVFNQNLNSSALITRGSGASASTGNNSFRTTGFQSNGISVSNTDYFEVTLSPSAGYKLSLSTIDATLAGTATFAASPGTSSQFAYSIDGINFILIETPQIIIGTPATLNQVSLLSIPSLQNVSSETTITIRYYASGQTTTGGWGFYSSAVGNYGLAIGGAIELAGSTFINISVTTALTESNLNNAEITLTLTNETFVASLQSSYFTLNNAPSGTTIQSVSRVSDTEATITLTFDGTDFDEDVTNFNITASADALTGNEPLTGNNLTITAHTAPVAITNAATGTINGNATLNGTVTSKGYVTTVIFEYSTDETLLTGVSEVTATQSPLASDAISAAVSYSLTGLTNGETYYYRVQAQNTEGTTIGSIISFTSVATPTLFISEVADPLDVANAKYVEIFNYGETAINLLTSSIFLARQANGVNVANINLDGIIQPHGTFVIANNATDYLNSFNKSANQTNATVSGNGDDGYFLYLGSGHPGGTLFDAYGILDENGVGKTWFYQDSKATRKNTVTSPNPNWTADEWNIIPNANVDRMIPGIYPKTIWRGSVNNAWTNTNNWDNGLPVGNINVMIWSGGTNFPELESASSVNNLIVQHNAQLNGQENLTVTGTTTVLHQIEFSSTQDNLNRWQYFTSPFTDLTAGGMLSSNARVDLYLVEYDNSIEGTIHEAWGWLGSVSTPITPAKGFAVTTVNDVSETGNTINTSYYNMASSGTLVNATADVSTNLQYQGAELNNWNLIGNPFLAPIDWFDNINLDYSKIQGNAAYIFNPVTGTYITLTSTGSGAGTVTPSGTQYIPPMQGFFVQALSSGSFEIAQAARVNNKQNFYKSEPLLPILRLKASADSLFDETVIIFNEMASNNFDRYDANKLITNGKSPQIYTTLESGHNLVFNHTHTLETTIGVQLIGNTTGQYTLSMNEIGTLFNDYNITLTDHALQKSVMISDIDYQFEANEENSIYNFTLSFQKRTSVKISDLSDLKVYVIKNQLIIQSGYDHTGKVTICDLSGKTLAEQPVSGFRSTIDLKNRSGLFIIRLTGVNGTSHHKVIVNL